MTKNQSIRSNYSVKKNLSNNPVLPGNVFDVIVIGGGSAGMSAALWCEELGLKTLLLEAERELGGQLTKVYNPIKNHLGTETENGFEMREIFLEQIKKRKFGIFKKAEVAKVDFEEKKIFTTDGRFFSSRAIVIATGVSRRKLNVEGEEKFVGKGILESGKRDAEKVSDKTVCIVGGGDAALENALILSEHAAKVYLIHRRKNFRARPEFVTQVLKNPKVEVLTETIIKEICGNKKIEAVQVEDAKTRIEKLIRVDAVLIRIGVKPNTEIFREILKLDKHGYIKTKSNGETKIKSIFAVGDVANPTSPTVSTAVGTGATAGKTIFNQLK